MYAAVALWKEEKQQLPLSPFTKLVPATLGRNNTLADLFLSVEKHTSAVVGANRVVTLCATLNYGRKPGWRIIRASRQEAGTCRR